MRRSRLNNIFFLSVLTVLLVAPIFAFAHPGRTDAYGCHTCRTNCPSWGLSYGEYHCHNAKVLPQPIEPITSTYDAGGMGYTTPAPEYKQEVVLPPVKSEPQPVKITPLPIKEEMSVVEKETKATSTEEITKKEEVNTTSSQNDVQERKETKMNSNENSVQKKPEKISFWRGLFNWLFGK